MFKAVFLVVFGIISSVNYYANGQDDENETCSPYYDENINKVVYIHPQIIADYPGGTPELLSYIAKNIKGQKQDELQGRVTLAFIVDEDGMVRCIKVVRKINRDLTSIDINEYKNEEEYTPYDREYVRVAKTMQPWIPAKCNGISVPSLMFLPIHFHPMRSTE